MDVDWIKSQLAEHGMTQAQLAVKAGLTEAQLSKSLKGGRAMKAEEADAIRRTFGWPLPEDLSSDDPKARIWRRLVELPERQQMTLVLFLESLEKQ